MGNLKMDFPYKNGTASKIENKKSKFGRIFLKLEFNEWTFSLCLFLLSLAIVVVKVFLIYGDALPETIKTINYKRLENLSLLIDLNNENLNNEKIMNATKLYRDTLFDSFCDLTDNFGWFIKAFISGLSMMGFTWFIVYKDSNIPGINPPSPFSPSKNQKFIDNSKIQMNYLVGVINGVLVFFYLCL